MNVRSPAAIRQSLGANSFARQVVAMSGSQLIGYSVQGIYFVALARMLGPSEYGVFAGSLALVTVFASLSGAGAGNYMVLSSTRAPDKFRLAYGTALVYLALTFIPLAVAVLAVAAAFSSSSFLPTVLPLLFSEIIFLRGLDVAFQAHQVHDALGWIARTNLGLSIARLLTLTAFWIVTGGGAVSGEWASVYALSNVSFCIWAHSRVVRKFGRPKWDLRYGRSVFRNSYPFALGMASRILYVDSDKFLLGAIANAATAGAYSAGARLVNMAFSPIQALIYSSNTRLFRAANSGRADLRRGVRKLLIVAVPTAVLLMLVLYGVSFIVPHILGSEYAETAQVIRLLSPLVVLQSVHYVLGDALMAAGHQLARSIAQLSIGIASVLVNLAVIPHAGWLGAGIVSIVSAAVLCLATGGFAFRLWVRTGNENSGRI